MITKVIMENKLIYLLRHGDIGLGREKRYIGQTDIPLSSKGEKQAHELKEIFSQVGLDNIYCSDLMRSHKTASIIASVHGKVPTVCAELRELNMGNWEGRLFSEVKSSQSKEFVLRGQDIANYRPLQGESFADCSDRVIPWFESIVQNKERNVLCVAHAGVNRIILSHVLGIPLARVFCIEQGYGCINLIVAENSEYRLRLLNWSSLNRNCLAYHK